MTCGDCKKQSVPGEQFFVRPTPARSNSEKQTREEKQQLDFHQPEPGKTVIEAFEQPLCKKCYYVVFRQIYPGAALPKLPDPPEPDTVIEVLPKAQGDVHISSPE